MTVRKVSTRTGVRWEVRGRVGGRGSKSIRKRFLRKEDAQRWATEQTRAKQLGSVIVESQVPGRGVTRRRGWLLRPS
jgi:hypothetical protein